MTYNITQRELLSDEIAICPYDNNIYFVIKLQDENILREGCKICDKPTISRSSRYCETHKEHQRYKVQLFNKEFNAYGETTYDLKYYQARNRLSQLISDNDYKGRFENEQNKHNLLKQYFKETMEHILGLLKEDMLGEEDIQEKIDEFL